MNEKPSYLNSELPSQERVNDLLSRMTLSQKIGQMVQAEWPNISPKEMEEYELGSLLSGGEILLPENTKAGWKKIIQDYQDALAKTSLKIPMIFGVDAVHGHNNMYGATIFPHNIGLGAANDVEGVFKMSQITGKEVLATGINWNFSPSIASAKDPRWGRTYESFSTDPAIASRLGLAFTQGHLSVGMVGCAKHYLGDGGTKMGTGLSNKMDRGNTILTKTEITTELLPPYQAQIAAGVQTIMPSYSSLNGTKMHENSYYIQEVLKGALGFQGFIISDYEAIREIKNANFEEQIWKAVNSGIDMLMEPVKWKSTIYALKRGVENEHIREARIDDAVSRILKVKFESGLFEDPNQNKTKFQARQFRAKTAQKVAQDLAQRSLVLLKNEKAILPIPFHTKIFITGAGVHNIGLQCGGWTIDWNGRIDGKEKITEGVTILEGLKNLAPTKRITLIKDKKEANKADIVLQVLSEKPYAEMNGDCAEISLIGPMAHPDNEATMNFVNTLNKPTVTVILAGRHLANLEKDLATWDACIMAYLPGSEGGQAIADTLLGKTDFVGRLPMPWYKTVEDIEKVTPDLLFDIGYGLSYPIG